MSMSSADILYSTITEMIDTLPISDSQSKELHSKIGKLYDIAEGNVCNHRESDLCNCPNKPKQEK